MFSKIIAYGFVWCGNDSAYLTDAWCKLDITVLCLCTACALHVHCMCACSVHRMCTTPHAHYMHTASAHQVVTLAWMPILIPSFGNYSVIRSVRALRPLRALKRVPGMPVLVSSIMAGRRFKGAGYAWWCRSSLPRSFGTQDFGSGLLHAL